LRLGWRCLLALTRAWEDFCREAEAVFFLISLQGEQPPELFNLICLALPVLA